MGEVDAVAWLRQRIRERMYLAQRAIELGNAAEWVEQSSGVLVTGEPTETDTWHGTWPMGDSSLTRLMEANDPGDTIARCEAELAILDEHRLILADRGDSYTAHPEYRIARDNPTDKQVDMANMMQWSKDCRACRGRYPCRTVRLLATGYRHRPGCPASLLAVLDVDENRNLS